MNRHYSPPTASYFPANTRALAYYLSPKQRLDTLFSVHAAVSILAGVVGYLWPGTAGAFFSTESQREASISRAIVRPLCSLILAQGIIIWRARKIIDGAIKRAFVQAYFICFSLATLSFLNEHMQNGGVVSGKLVAILKIIFMIALSAGYGWFTFFQPPAVFHGLAMHSSGYR